MPMQYQKKKKYGRKYFKRQHKKAKYGKKGNKDNLFRSGKAYGVRPSPFPNKLNAVMKYTFGDTLTTATTAGLAGTEQQFQLNALQTPWYNNPGTANNNVSVVGLADMALLYYDYIVTGAKVEVKFSNPSQDGIVGICSLNQWSQAGNNYVRHINEDALTYTTVLNNTGSQARNMNFFIRPWSLQGLSKIEWLANKTGHSAHTNADPTEVPLLRVVVANTQDTAAATMRVDIRIYYYTTFFTRKQLNSSAN